MKRLILFRHAKTERDSDSGRDFDRRLTDRGCGCDRAAHRPRVGRRRWEGETDALLAPEGLPSVLKGGRELIADGLQSIDVDPAR